MNKNPINYNKSTPEPLRKPENRSDVVSAKNPWLQNLLLLKRKPKGYSGE